MSDLEKNFNQAANAPKFDKTAHMALLETLEQTDADHVPLTMRFNMMNYLQRVIIHLAKANDHKVQSPTNKDDFVVDESQFPREMALLLSLNDSVQFSAKLSQHFDIGRDALIKGLKADPIFSAGPKWEEATTEEKLDMLNRFIKRSVTAHCPFSVENEITGAADPHNSSGCFAFARQQFGRDEDYVTIGRTQVVFSRHTLDNLSIAVRLAYHESIHICISRMAIAFANKVIPQGHDLYEDAAMKFTAILQDSSAIPVIHSHYMADPEERIVYGEQEKFENLIIGSTSADAATRPVPR